MTESTFLNDFEAHLSRAEDYLNPSSELRSCCLAGLKTVFDLLQKRCRESPVANINATTESAKKAANKRPSTVPSGPLSELYVDGFDADQIWEQVELVNRPLIAHLTKQVEKISHWDLNKLIPGDGGGGSRRTEVAVSDTGSDGTGDWESDLDGEEDERELGSSDGEREESRGKRARVSAGRKTVVDDRFFKLAEMEAFLEKMEKEHHHQRQQDSSDLDSDLESDEGSAEVGEGDIDYFADIPSDDELGGNADGKKRALYGDFFDDPEGEEVKTRKSESSLQGNKDVKRYEKEEVEGDGESSSEKEEWAEGDDELAEGEGEREGVVDEDFGEMDEGEEEEEEEEGESEMDGEMDMELFEEGTTELNEDAGEEGKQVMSTHEKMQLRIQERISSLEEANLDQRSWQMGGEATAKTRPENSLLEENLSFEHMTRPAPVITEETTKSLEDIIKQRILDEAWDDVERRVKPKEKPYDYSRTRPLDQEKSKLSLAEVYEKEYIKQTQAFEEVKEDERHTQIKEMMTKLFVKLDALSNFHFTPKPPKPEVKIVANVPAIQMEEVAPLATSDAALLAPEEIQVKSKIPEVGESEKTSTNRKRERRLKKRQKRLRLADNRQREKLVSKLRPGLGNKYTKKSFAKKLEERDEEERVDKSLKSSSQFFARLQEQVREQVKGAKAEESRTKKGRTTRSQQYKL